VLRSTDALPPLLVFVQPSSERCAKRCARTAPLPRSRSLRLCSWSSSVAGLSKQPRMRSQRGASGSAARQDGTRPLLGPGVDTYTERLPDAPAGAAERLGNPAG
jgi:hypothetical protein